MGKKIRITESQLTLITKSVMSEATRSTEAYIQQYNAFKKDMKHLKLYSEYTKDIFEYLDLLRETGIVNMYQASTFLWGGRDFIERHAQYHAPHIAEPDEYLDDEAEYERFMPYHQAYLELLDKAEEMRSILISAAATTLPMDDDDFSDRGIQRHVEKVAGVITSLWMKHFGTRFGRGPVEIAEMSRSLAFARRQRLFPKNAKKYNKLRFRPAKREMDESDVVLKEKMDVTCKNCGHAWDIRPEDKEPHLCHMCGYDQKKKEFFHDKVIEFWQDFLDK